MKLMGTTMDANGNTKQMNLLDDPRIIDIIKYGGEIVIPDNRPDMYAYFLDMQKINPKIKIVKSQNIVSDAFVDSLTKGKQKEKT